MPCPTAEAWRRGICGGRDKRLQQQQQPLRGAIDEGVSAEAVAQAGCTAGCSGALATPMWGCAHVSDMPVRRSDYAVLHNLDEPPPSARKISPYGITLLRKNACRREKDDCPEEAGVTLGESKALFRGSPRKSGSPRQGDEGFFQQPARASLYGSAERSSSRPSVVRRAAAQDNYALSEYSSVKGGLTWVSLTSDAGHIFRDERDGGGPYSEPLRRDITGSSSSSDAPMSLPAASGLAGASSSDSTFLESLCGGAAAEDLQLQCRKFPTWAQQTEQTYSLQLALALRMVAEAELTDEPCLLGPPTQASSASPRASVDATAHRLWVNGSLAYSDTVQDGFLHIWGMNPYVWSMCNDSDSGGRMPSLESLRAVNPEDASFDVILVDKSSDSHLRELEAKAEEKAAETSNCRVLAEQLAKLVCSLLGGAALEEHGDLAFRWEESSRALKECLNSVVLPVGSLSVGLCRHRALLFKTLADRVNLPCRIVKGCKYCFLEEGASCNILCGDEGEFYVDLIAQPGVLSELSFMSFSSMSVASPLRMSDSIDSQNERSLSRRHGSGGSSSSSSSAQGTEEGMRRRAARMKQYENYRVPANNIWPVRTSSAMSDAENVVIKGGIRIDIDVDGTKCSEEIAADCADSRRAGPTDGNQVTTESTVAGKGKTVTRHLSPILSGRDMKLKDPEHTAMDSPEEGSNSIWAMGFKAERVATKETKDLLANVRLDKSLAVIRYEDLHMAERVGQGSFGTVHRADWLGSDVAVKVLTEQDFEDERIKEFLREVSILSRLRHPNIVLFMGVVIERPHFSIVTEYLPRGSLFRLLHRTSAKDFLDERRRIRMAVDVAKGVNYLHRSQPPIVHRDLKTPNLLVDKNWTVKVCDFGLSRLKGNTFLSSRSGAGTPEWMAPEVLRDEQATEKCDVYSFGVVMWELVTLQQPWNGLSPPQVVGAVGFQGRRLQIPGNTSPQIVSLIESCWQNEPKLRPSFSQIMQQLRPLRRLTADAV